MILEGTVDDKPPGNARISRYWSVAESAEPIKIAKSISWCQKDSLGTEMDILRSRDNHYKWMFSAQEEVSRTQAAHS